MMIKTGFRDEVHTRLERTHKSCQNHKSRRDVGDELNINVKLNEYRHKWTEHVELKKDCLNQ